MFLKGVVVFFLLEQAITLKMIIKTEKEENIESIKIVWSVLMTNIKVSHLIQKVIGDQNIFHSKSFETGNTFILFPKKKLT